MAGLYGRVVDPNFAAPGRGGVGANAGIGAQGAPALPRAQEDDFNAAQMAGLLGLMAKQKEQAGSAAPGAAAEGGALGQAPGMTPITNEGNFDWQPAMPQANPAAALPNGGNFAMPPAGSGDAFQLGNVGGAAPLMSNFGAGIPQAAAPAASLNPVAGMQMPVSIGGAGIGPTQLQGILGGFGFGR